MYNSESIANRIKKIAKNKRITLRNLLADCELSINTISKLSKGNQISYISLAKMADRLECSIDFILGRTTIINSEKINILVLPNSKLFFLDSRYEIIKSEFSKRKQKKIVDFINSGIVDHITIGEKLQPIYTICTEDNVWIDFSQSDFGKIIFNSEDEAKKYIKKGCKL
ncbi:MAG: helix-turn-helix domain-containing protein [Clostridia bacterium]|nr:helix-turn-helix domain-containing protein [Clostridia bacterium]